MIQAYKLTEANEILERMEEYFNNCIKMGDWPDYLEELFNTKLFEESCGKYLHSDGYEILTEV